MRNIRQIGVKSIISIHSNSDALLILSYWPICMLYLNHNSKHGGRESGFDLEILERQIIARPRPRAPESILIIYYITLPSMPSGYVSRV